MKTIFKRIDEVNPKLSGADKFVSVVIIIVDVVLKTFLPFTLGFYFHQTQSLIYLFLVILSMLFFPEIDYDKGTIKLSIKRLL